MIRSHLSSRNGILAVVSVIILVGIASLLLFTQNERDRDRVRWADNLNFIADNTARDVAGWISTQFNELNTLANNTALQIYFLELQQQAKSSAPAAQGDYLRNQLTLTAQRLGFEPNAPTIDQQVNADVQAPAAGGLALVDKTMRPLMASAAMPALTPEVTGALQAAPPARAQIIDLPDTGDGTPRIVFMVPVYALQAERTAENQIGSIIGVRLLDAPFFRMLQPQTIYETLETALVKPSGNQLRYIMPSASHSPSEQNEPNQAAAFAAGTPGQFAEKMDYKGNAVFVTGRAVADTPWTLLAKIDREEVLAQSASWRRNVALMTVLLTCCIVAIILAITRNADARRLAEREKRLRTLNQLIGMLVSLIDRRDPSAAQHSAYTAQVAGATAREMGLDAVTVDTAEIAARLLNLGKADIPAELLTRKSALNENERFTVRSSLASSADLVEGIEFEGPVADTIRQAQEHVDGSGPLGLADAEILLPARIVAAANAFIGMISARAWRKAMSFEEAQQILMQSMDKQFDRRVVLAMMHYLDNHGGREAVAPLTMTEQSRPERAAE